MRPQFFGKAIARITGCIEQPLLVSMRDFSRAQSTSARMEIQVPPNIIAPGAKTGGSRTLTIQPITHITPRRSASVFGPEYIDHLPRQRPID
jgi:hypothetical protein